MVIADVRFENEAEFVRRLGGTLVHIVRPDIYAVAAHASENGVTQLPADKVLHNGGSLEELQVNIRQLFD